MFDTALPYSVPLGREFERQFGVGEPMQRRLIRDGEVESFLLGAPRGRRHIITRSYLAYVERQQRREAAGELGLPSPNPKAKRRGIEPETAALPRSTVHKTSADRV